MRNQFKIILAMGVFAMALAACEHHTVYDTNNKKVTELEVPAGFDWNVSEELAFTVSSPVETSVSVYGDPENTKLLATVTAPVEKKTYFLSVGPGTENLYVEYRKADETAAVLTVPVVATRSLGGNAELKLPEDAGRYNKEDEWIYYPNYKNGWGTLLFEDMWPAMGDYDFNDFVAFYKVQVAKDQILFAVRLNALGGYLPYQLGVQIDDLKAQDVAWVKDYGMIDPESYAFETEGADPAVFIFNWKDKKGSKGGNYYNTEKKYEVSFSDLEKNQISFIVGLGKEVDIEHIRHTSFNFFIRKNDGTEIHLKGYKPTKAFETEYKKIVAANPELLNPEVYYASKNNFVWGLKVPEGIGHAQETIDFTKAYKFFGEWVTSNGRDHKNWYKEEAGKDFRIENR